MVQANETTAYPHIWLAQKLNIPLELLNETLRICQEQERISENSDGIRIMKFEYYQETKEVKELEAAPELSDQKPLSKKDMMQLKAERKRLGLCENCGEEGHTKYNCPHSNFQGLVKR